MHKKLIRPLSVLTLLFAVLLLCGITARAAGTDIEDWQTVLVNPWNTLPEDHTVSLETVTGHYKVDTRCCDDLKQMLADCRAAGYEPQICSAYRTQAQQEYLFSNNVQKLRNAGYSYAEAKRVAARSVAVPGTSEHQLGLAVDIVDADYPYLNNYQARQDTQKWLMENCWKYGFILRYPVGKSEITGIVYEPWHYRYVGHTLAKQLYDAQMTLEEYHSNVPFPPVVSVTTVADTGKIRLSWDPVENASYYQIYRAESKNGKYYKMTPTAGTTYDSVSITIGQKYYYKVRAVSADGSVSAFSNTVSRTCRLPRPTVTAANITATGKIRLTWSAVKGADHYEICRAENPDGPYVKMTPTTGTAYTSVSVTPGKTYYYRVTAVSSSSPAADSVRSRTVCCTCKPARPKVTVSNISATGKLRLTWEKVPGAYTYQVYRAESKDGPYTPMTPVRGTVYTSLSLTVGQRYYYKVEACSKSGTVSAQSAPVSAVCRLRSPSPAVSLNKNGIPVISWKAVDGAAEYEVYRASSPNGTYHLLNSTTETAYTNPSARSGKTYYYKVRAVYTKDSASSAYSSVVSVHVP